MLSSCVSFCLLVIQITRKVMNGFLQNLLSIRISPLKGNLVWGGKNVNRQ